MWKWLDQYFTFTRGEKNGIFLLVSVTIVAAIVPSVYSFFTPVETVAPSELDEETKAFIAEYNQKKLLAMADSLSEETDSLSEFNPYASVAIHPRFKNTIKPTVKYFEFDPNKINQSAWVQLGFSQKQAQSIERLKAKGFIFYTPEDLKKVYVIGEDNYLQLAPYIKIDSSQFQKRGYVKKKFAPKAAPTKYVVDINTADSSLFERQRGIGSSLASRIIKYRNRLGGFVSPEQIKEVWNFPDSTYQQLKDRFVVGVTTVSKVNINTADYNTLGSHPYINYRYAKVIVAYRQQHGNFTAIADIKKTGVISDSVFYKVEPYLTVE